jgi:AcrR family transcriptional regulator
LLRDYTEFLFRLQSGDVDKDHVVATATSQPPRAKRADAVRNRERVLEAARKCMALRGLDVQMDEIAKKAGVGVGTVYRHFPTKDALVQALIVDHMERMADVAKASIDAEGEPWEAFSRTLWNGAEQQLADRALAQVLATQPPATWQHAAEAQTSLSDHMATLLARAQEAGAVRADLRVDDIPLMMCGLGAVVQNGRDWQRYMRLVLDGMRACGSDPLPN